MKSSCFQRSREWELLLILMGKVLSNEIFYRITLSINYFKEQWGDKRQKPCLFYSLQLLDEELLHLRWISPDKAFK
jgi:hypothetical protein